VSTTWGLYESWLAYGSRDLAAAAIHSANSGSGARHALANGAPQPALLPTKQKYRQLYRSRPRVRLLVSVLVRLGVSPVTCNELPSSAQRLKQLSARTLLTYPASHSWAVVQQLLRIWLWLW